MLINNIDIQQYNASLLDRQISTNKINAVEEWNDGAVSSHYIRSQNSFKNIVITLLINDESETAAFIHISQIAQQLKKGKVCFKDMESLEFPVTLNSKTNPERLLNGKFKVTFILTNSYAIGESFSIDLQDPNKRYPIKVLYVQDTEANLIKKTTVTITPQDFLAPRKITDFIDLNRYQPLYYEEGVLLNAIPEVISYEQMREIDTFIVFYKEKSFDINFNFYNVDDTSLTNKTFIANEIRSIKHSSFLTDTIAWGDIVDINKYRDDGKKTIFSHNIATFSFEYLILHAPFDIYYVPASGERTKNLTVNYYNLGLNENIFVGTTTIVAHEFDFLIPNNILNIIDVNLFLDPTQYTSGLLASDSPYKQLIVFDNIVENDIINIIYSPKNIFITVSYYQKDTLLGVEELSVTALNFRENTTWLSLGLEPKKYLPQYYTVTNESVFTQNVTFEQVIQNPAIEVYYQPVNYTIPVVYYKDYVNSTIVGQEELVITYDDYFNNKDYFNDINLTAYTPDNYKFGSIVPQSIDSFFNLVNLTEIQIYYIPRPASEQVKIYQTLYFEEDTIDGFKFGQWRTVRPSDFDANTTYDELLHAPDFQPAGFTSYKMYMRGAHDQYEIKSGTKVTFDEFEWYDEKEYLTNTGEGFYYIVYHKPYDTLPVEYYIDSVSPENFLGSSVLPYTKKSANAAENFDDLGLDVDRYKPSNCKNGYVTYTGKISYEILQGLTGIVVIYERLVEDIPDEVGTIYPNKTLYVLNERIADFDTGVGKGAKESDITTIVTGKYSKIDTRLGGNGAMFGAASMQYGMALSTANLLATMDFGSYYYKVFSSTSNGQVVTYEDISFLPASTHGLYAAEYQSDATAINALDVKFNGKTIARRVLEKSQILSDSIHIFSDASKLSPASYLEISSVKIYIKNVLVRDMIAVEEGDLIGKLIAPSNCFFDKISRTFIENRNKNKVLIKDNKDLPSVPIEPYIGITYYSDIKGIIANEQKVITADMFNENTTLADLVDINKYRPAGYTEGTVDYVGDISFEALSYQNIKILYTQQANTVDVLYYTAEEKGDKETYVGSTTLSYTSNIDTLNTVTLEDIGYDRNLYQADGYNAGISTLDNTYISTSTLANVSSIKTVYHPTVYQIVVKYWIDKRQLGISTFSYTRDDLVTAKTLEDLGFSTSDYLPEGFQLESTSFNPEDYHSPQYPDQAFGIDLLKHLKEINVYYALIPEPPQPKEKSITVQYKWPVQMMSGVAQYEYYNETVIITKDLIPSGAYVSEIVDVDMHRGEYYDRGILNEDEFLTYAQFEDGKVYYVEYLPTQYTKSVVYYADELDDENIIGTATLYYNVLSFGGQKVNLISDLGLRPSLYRQNNYAEHLIRMFLDFEERDEWEFYFYDMVTSGDIQVLYFTILEPEPDDILLPNNLYALWINQNWKEQISFHVFNIKDLPVGHRSASTFKYEIKFDTWIAAEDKYGTLAFSGGYDGHGSGAQPAKITQCPIGVAYYYQQAGTPTLSYSCNTRKPIIGYTPGWIGDYEYDPSRAPYKDIYYNSAYFNEVYATIQCGFGLYAADNSKDFHYNYYFMTPDDSPIAERNAFGVAGSRKFVKWGAGLTLKNPYNESYYTQTIYQYGLKWYLDREYMFEKPMTITVDYSTGMVNSCYSPLLYSYKEADVPVELYVGAATDNWGRKPFGYGYHSDSGYSRDIINGELHWESSNLDGIIPISYGGPRVHIMRFWYLKIWHEGRLIRDYIPMKKGANYAGIIAEENCLFDKITRTCVYPYLGAAYRSSRAEVSIHTDDTIDPNYEYDRTVKTNKALYWENDTENNQNGYINIIDATEKCLPRDLTIDIKFKYDGNGEVFGLVTNENDNNPGTFEVSNSSIVIRQTAVHTFPVEQDTTQSYVYMSLNVPEQQGLLTSSDLLEPKTQTAPNDNLMFLYESFSKMPSQLWFGARTKVDTSATKLEIIEPLFDNGIKKLWIKGIVISVKDKILHNYIPIDRGETIDGLTAEAPGLYDTITKIITYTQGNPKQSAVIIEE